MSKNKRFVRNDILLILLLLILAGVGAVYLFCFRPAGNTVQVTVDSKIYGTYPLSQDTRQDICTGAENEYHNLLVIRDGKAYMESATCPDGICVDHAPIFRDGESIVCLPQRVVITVITDEKDQPDIIV